MSTGSKFCQEMVEIGDKLFSWVRTKFALSFQYGPLLVEGSFGTNGIDILIAYLITANYGKFPIVTYV